jgi:hypothetical protein
MSQFFYEDGQGNILDEHGGPMDIETEDEEGILLEQLSNNA